MGDMGERPDHEGDGIAEARADQVDQPAEADIADRISGLEPEDDVGEVDLGPAEIALAAWA